MRNELDIIQDLYQAKQAEANAKAKRIALEHELETAIGIPEDWEGSQTRTVNVYKVKVTKKMNITVDPKKLRDVANTYGLNDRLKTLFRWKPELNKKAWGEAPENERTVFATAMKSSPSKASFNIKLDTEAMQ